FSVPFPPGTTALSYHAAILGVYIGSVGSPFLAGDLVSVWLQDNTGQQLFYQQTQLTAALIAQGYLTFPFPLGMGSLGSLSVIWIATTTESGLAYCDLILDQEPIC